MEGITKLNGVTYKYKYKISNSTGELSITDPAVISLVYFENIFDPFADGAITIANPDNFIESTFLYRGDGTDKLEFLLENESSKAKISGTYTIIGENNIVDDGTPIKNKKTYIFCDETEQLMRQKFPYGKKYSGKAGDILKDILEKEFKFTIDGKFEPGDFVLSVADPFVPSINYRYLDLIYYLLQYYYFKDGDTPVKGILQKTRAGKYSFKTLSKDFFEQNEKLLTEVFHSGSLIGTKDVGRDSQDNPSTPGNTPYNETINNPTSISFDSTNVDESNQFFMNSLVVSYDDVLGDHYIDEIRVKDVRKIWEKKFVEPFKMKYGKPKKYLPMSKEKLEGEFKTYRLPYSREQNVGVVTANMINDFIFRNNQITLTVNGDIKRQPGTFIDIVKSKDDKNKGDAKLLGRWLVTGVDHIKLGATYRNTIKAVKTFAGPTYQEKDV